MNRRFAIYCDFDGTVTTRDTVDFLLTHLADPEWQAVEQRWENGEIGSRECMSRQIPLLRGGWSAVEALLKDVVIDPTFAGFVDWCNRQSIPLVLVSEGLDRVIHFLLAREGIQIARVWANTLQEDAEGAFSLAFPHAPTDVSCQSGLCKCNVLQQSPVFPEQDIHRVVIGDGFSDRCWASAADTLFAKSKLIRHCEENHISYIPFDNFDTIRNVLEKQLRLFPKTHPSVISPSAKQSAGSGS